MKSHKKKEEKVEIKSNKRPNSEDASKNKKHKSDLPDLPSFIDDTEINTKDSDDDDEAEARARTQDMMEVSISQNSRKMLIPPQVRFRKSNIITEDSEALGIVKKKPTVKSPQSKK